MTRTLPNTTSSRAIVKDRSVSRKTVHAAKTEKRGGAGKLNWGGPLDYYDERLDVPLETPFEDADMGIMAATDRPATPKVASRATTPDWPEDAGPAPSGAAI